MPQNRHKCLAESGSTSTQHIQEVLTDASEERSLIQPKLKKKNGTLVQ